jgi:hypothetical protein
MVSTERKYPLVMPNTTTPTPVPDDTSLSAQFADLLRSLHGIPTEKEQDAERDHSAELCTPSTT